MKRRATLRHILSLTIIYLKPDDHVDVSDFVNKGLQYKSSMPGVIVVDDDGGFGSCDDCVGVVRRCPDQAVWRYRAKARARGMRE